ncbi:MAG: InlB B-repeat-containing protein [Clostridia bacterium]|nr:InlB B-repeat-containing protein [Clostridia bacterium]
MKKFLCSLIALTLCFSAAGCGSFSGFLDDLGELLDPFVDYNEMRYEYASKGGLAYYITEWLNTETTKEAHYIEREVGGIPVKCLGDLMGFGGSIRLYEENTMVKHLYCPGTITMIVDGYLQPHESYQEDEILTVYYCGKIVDLRRLGYGKNLVYYVPAEQLDEYQTLWQAQTEDFTADTYEGEVRAANVEYHLNAGDMEDFYYVDYVTPGNRIQNVPPIPLREAWEFVGWYPENSETVWSETAQVPEDGLKLYAKWREI